MEAVMSIQFKNLAAVAATATFLLLGQQAVAQQQRACCEPCWDICGDWKVGAEALYFTPITCPYAYGTNFVVVSSPGFSSQDGQADVVPCTPEWGFRVFGNYLCDCFFACVSYQRYNGTAANSFVGTSPSILGGAFAGPAKITGRVQIEYQNVDVRLGQYFLRGCRSSLYLYGNGRWIDLSHRRSARQAILASGTALDTQEKSQLEGGALGIGCGGEVDVWCNFGAYIDANLLGVIGRRSLKDVRFRTITLASTVNSQQGYPSDTCVTPEVDFRIGLNYTYQCGCWTLVGEVGYEVDHFWHASMFPDLVTTIDTDADENSPRDFVPVCEDLGFSGLFFGARLIF